ncbi:hypothetical protein C8A05DRAFT_15653 [Staphylotrichum tortipilum]|uniref:Uncharacterized protein n=1 Tax=Staphylotrichum tortipilum TaxID=2831512 RepID=A0AAN6MLL5_9PEZI|nr:hypothetical protein C8A05DRAFT_15653 [Staphylotrichum longicolle]
MTPPPPPLHYRRLRRVAPSGDGVSVPAPRGSQERSSNQRWRRRSIPQLMTAHVFLICLIFRWKAFPGCANGSGVQADRFPAVSRKVDDTTAVDSWQRSKATEGGRMTFRYSLRASGTVGRLQQWALKKSKQFPTRQSSRCSAEAPSPANRQSTGRPCQLQQTTTVREHPPPSLPSL